LNRGGAEDGVSQSDRGQSDQHPLNHF
jgi:hypothetical protein